MSTETLLSSWQRKVIPVLERHAVAKPCVANVTLLSYFYWNDERIETLFYAIQCAFLCARRFCGMLPAILVVNRTTPAMIRFCDDHQITLHVDAALNAGLSAMNLDSLSKVHTRFDTEYVLTIHSDGFPLRSGLEAFVGKYDYIGAPWGKMSWFTELIFPSPKYSVGNTGFSLRSRRLCELAATVYQKNFRFLPYTPLAIDDLFYCKTLPRFWKTCRETMTYAPVEVAGQFSFEAALQYYSPNACPLGFHSWGFPRIMADFGTHINASLGITR